jgi:hypothetical protein
MAWAADRPGLVAAAAFAVAVAALVLRGGRRKVPDVARRPFLTGNEAEFLGRLEAALPEVRVHCQVAMGALLVPRIPEGGGKRRRAAHAAVRARFDRKVVDYVLQDRRSGAVLAVVELDDRTHVPERDRRRDAMMGRAGYRTIRWDSRRKPGAARIREAVLGEAAAAAPQRPGAGGAGASGASHAAGSSIR